MQPANQVTVADLQSKFYSNTAAQIVLDWGRAESHSERVEIIERAIDHLGLQLTKSRHLKQKMSEDQLTIDIVHGLSNMGIDATHDTQYGGHCDIVVESVANFLWIAEAKIHKTYNWLLSGFDQLNSRYSTGMVGQDKAEVIIYSYRQNIAGMMGKWKEHLSKNRSGITFSQCTNDPLVFRSEHKHPLSGSAFTVRHRPIALHFKPVV